MGLLKDMFTLHRQAAELDRTWDPGAQMRQGVERMRQMNETLATQARAQDLARTGVPATASIIELVDTGTRLNFAPVIRLGLLVECAGRPPYPVRTETVLPVQAGAQAGVGQRVAVVVDPANHENVLVRWGQPVD